MECLTHQQISLTGSACSCRVQDRTGFSTELCRAVNTTVREMTNVSSNGSVQQSRVYTAWAWSQLPHVMSEPVSTNYVDLYTHYIYVSSHYIYVSSHYIYVSSHYIFLCSKDSTARIYEINDRAIEHILITVWFA